MLINITDGFLDNLADVDENFVDSFEELVSLHVKAFHYVAASRIVAKSISEILAGRISNKTKNALIQIGNQSDSSISLIKNIKFYLEIRTSKLDGVVVEERNGARLWVCNVKYANQWCSHPLKIIGENVVDGDACMEAARHYSIVNSYPANMAKATVEMSGGSGNADKVLEKRLIDAIAPIFSFIDSDKFCPDHEGSPAIKKCTDVLTKKNGVAIFHEIEARELENILPFDFVRSTIECMGMSPARDIVLDNLQLLKKILDTKPLIYKYLDLKFGTCSGWVLKQSQATIFHYGKQEKIGKCQCSNNCEGSYSPPIMQEILDKVIGQMKIGSPREIKKNITLENDSSWLKFGGIVFAMSIANNVRLT